MSKYNCISFLFKTAIWELNIVNTDLNRRKFKGAKLYARISCSLHLPRFEC